MNAWTYLGLGIIFEVIGTSCLKLSNGFEETLPTTLCIACFCAAMYVLSLSVKTLDISIVYAIWSGVGISLISLIGIFFFQEQLTFSKLFFIALIVVGVIGLQMTSPDAHAGASVSPSVNEK